MMRKVIAGLSIIMLFSGLFYEFSTTVEAATANFSQYQISTGSDGITDTKLFDFNDDGRLDVISAASVGDELILHANQGSNTFTDQTLAIFNGVRVLDIGDIDGDTNPDIVAGSQAENEIRWYKGDGSGAIVASSTVASSTDATAVTELVVVDLNDDDVLDVVSVGASQDEIVLHENDGSGNFTSRVIFTLPRVSRHNLGFGDFNNDGNTDLIHVSRDESLVRWLRNEGDGNYTPITIASGVSNVSGLSVADINGDGEEDVAVASVTGDLIQWYAGDGAGGFSTANVVTTNHPSISTVATGDMDNDGDIDIIGGSANSSVGSLILYKNFGDGSFDSEQFILPNSASHLAPEVGDLNGDGKLDVTGFYGTTDSLRGFENQIEPDTGGPALVSTDPVDDTADAATNNYSVTFDETVIFSATTSPLFSIYDADIDALVRSVGTSEVSGSGSDTLDITLDQPLPGSRSYYVFIEPNIIRDGSANFYAGLQDDTAWNFTTLDTEAADPGELIFTPADNETNVSIHTDFTIEFPENMSPTGTGFIQLRNVDEGTTPETYAVNGSQVTGGGTRFITIRTSAPLESATNYAITVDANALEDDAGNDFVGFSDQTIWNFTTEDITAPTLIDSEPADNDTAVEAVQPTISLTFDEDVLLRSGDFTIYNADDTVFETIAATGPRVSGSGSDTVTLYLSEDFAYSASYYLLVPAGVITDEVGNAFSGITSSTTLNFTTAIPSAADAAANGDIVIDFDQPVEKGAGNLTIYRASDGSVHEVIDVTSTQVTLNNGATGDQAIISPNDALESETNYYVIADAGAFVFVSDGQPVPENVAEKWRFAAPDETDPVLLTAELDPADNATGVPIDQVLRLTFSEPVVRGSGFISVVDDTGNQVLADIAISNDTQLIGAEESPVLSVYLTETLPFNSDIHVEFDDGLVEDLAGNPVSGISNSTDWNFTTVTQASSTYVATAGANNVAPTATDFLPPNNATDVSTTTPLTVLFSEPVTAGTGNISVYRADTDALVAEVSMGDAAVQLTPNTTVLSLTLPDPLATSTTYYVLADTGIVEDAAGADFAGISDTTTWRFETSVNAVPDSQSGADTAAPIIAELSPLDNAVDVATTTNFAVVFSEPVFLGTGNVRLYRSADNQLLETFDVTGSQVTGAAGSRILGIERTAALAPDRGYYLQLDAGIVVDGAGNAFAGTGGSDTRWNFITAAERVISQTASDESGGDSEIPDTTGPSARILYPTNGQTNVAISTSFNILFDESIVRQSGNLRLYQASDDSLLETISVTDGGQVQIGEERPSLSFSPSAALATGTEYYLTVDEGMVADEAGNDFAGITASSSWRFSTEVATSSTPAPQSIVPQIDPETGYITALTLVFSEPMNPGSGSISIYRSNDNTRLEQIAIGSSQISGFGTNLVTVTPSSPLPDTSGYYLNLSLGALEAVDDGEALPEIEDEETFAVDTTTPEEAEEESESESDTDGTTYGSLPRDTEDDTVALTTPPRCYALMQSYLTQGVENPRIEVLKFQGFLAANTTITTPTHGRFDAATAAAAKAFQLLYPEDILTPWGYDETRATGRVYLTTKRKVNELFCDYTGNPDTTFPFTEAEQAEIDTYRAGR